MESVNKSREQLKKSIKSQIIENHMSYRKRSMNV